MKSERAELYHALLKRVARELGEKPDAEVVKHVATFRLLRESLQVRLLDGQHVDPDDLLKVDAVLKQYLPQGKPLAVAIQYVEGVRGIYTCKHCGKRNELKPGEYTPITDKPAKPPPTADAAKPAAQPSAVAAPAPAPAPAPALKQSSKWSGQGDAAFMPAQNILAGAEGWAKATAWSGSANMLGPHGGGVSRGAPSPGDPLYSDHKPRTPEGK
jgi:hypothetical protein